MKVQKTIILMMITCTLLGCESEEEVKSKWIKSCTETEFSETVL